MRIHTVRAGESISDIAKLYGVDESALRIHNSISEDRLCEGDELLILIPTRTYTPRPKDSAEGIAARFGLRSSDIIQNNKELMKSKNPKNLALKYAPHPYGAGAANGYFYKDCSLSRLECALPYLTYVTFASAMLTDEGCEMIFRSPDAIKKCKESGVVPLIKVYDRRLCGWDDDKAVSELIRIAKSGGYGGITLDISDSERSEDELSEFIVNLRGSMIGNELILITELDGKEKRAAADYSDGCVLENDPAEPIDSFKKKLGEFADSGESIKTFVELPSFGRQREDYIPITEARELGRKSGVILPLDHTSSLVFFEHKRKGRIIYPSLKYIKAILDQINEFSYMGISFDIMRTPCTFLYMFARAYCSR